MTTFKTIEHGANFKIVKDYVITLNEIIIKYLKQLTMAPISKLSFKHYLITLNTIIIKYLKQLKKIEFQKNLEILTRLDLIT